MAGKWRKTGDDSVDYVEVGDYKDIEEYLASCGSHWHLLWYKGLVYATWVQPNERYMIMFARVPEPPNDEKRRVIKVVRDPLVDYLLDVVLKDDVSPNPTGSI